MSDEYIVTAKHAHPIQNSVRGYAFSYCGNAWSRNTQPTTNNLPECKTCLRSKNAIARREQRAKLAREEREQRKQARWDKRRREEQARLARWNRASTRAA